MATLDPSIILAGQPVDLVGAMGRGNELAAQTNALRAQTDLRNLYRTQGANILAGDQGALNALAGFDPMAAMEVQRGQLGLQGQRLDMQATQQRMDMLSREEQRAIEAFKAEKGAAAAAAAAAQIEDSVRMGMAIPDAASWDAFMSQNAPELVGQFANRQALAAKYMSMAEVLKMNEAPDPTKGAPTGYMFADPRNPAAGVKPLPGYADKPADEYGRYVQEEGAAGRKPMTRLEFEQAKKGKGMSYTTTNPDGSVTTFSMGGAQDKPATVGDVYTPGTPNQAVELIDSILANPSLGRITGPIEGGGGNNIDDLNAIQRVWYGPEGLDAIDKTNQLQSQAWMAARAMLKGGGQITDYESRKAEAAVARLSRAKGEVEFRAALTELRDAISEGARKLEAAGMGGGQMPTTTQQPPQGGSTRLRFNPETGDFE